MAFKELYSSGLRDNLTLVNDNLPRGMARLQLLMESPLKGSRIEVPCLHPLSGEGAPKSF